VFTFVNADVIARGLAGFDPDSAAVEASRIMLERLHALAARRADFAFETTLAARSLAGWLRDLRRDGSVVRLVYFWLESADLAVARVAGRVRTGGHAVPEATIRQRYHRSVRNFFTLYRPVVNSWQVYDNSQERPLPLLVAHGDEMPSETVLLEEVWSRIQKEGANE
jgi:predicted ABC-type ATPase